MVVTPPTARVHMEMGGRSAGHRGGWSVHAFAVGCPGQDADKLQTSLERGKPPTSRPLGWGRSSHQSGEPFANTDGNRVVTTAKSATLSILCTFKVAAPVVALLPFHLRPWEGNVSLSTREAHDECCLV